MPLSEHEQRLLEQMERALYAEDPKFASALDGAGLRTRSRRTVFLAAAGFVVGAALVVAGMVPSKPMAWLAALGVLLMAGCVALAVVAWRRMPRLGVVDPRTGMPVRRRRSSVVDRMEQRWHRRQDQQRGGV